MDIIEKYLKQNLENMELSVYSAYNDKQSIYLLFNKNLLLAGITIEHCEDVNYISYMDSTGFGRQITNKFIIGVIKSLYGLIICFSYPKNETLFAKSFQNGFKKNLNSVKLFNYWIKIFEETCEANKTKKETAKINEKHDCDVNETELRIKNDFDANITELTNKYDCNVNEIITKKVKIGYKNDCEINKTSTENVKINNNNKCFLMTWSNYNKSNCFPYKKINEIKLFKDDPKGKLLKKFKKAEKKKISINDFFNGLLFRYDFTKGGLLFYKCYCNTSKIKKEVCKNVNITKIISYLRHLDFSNKDKAEESTNNFINKFSIQLNYFETSKNCD